MSNKENDDIFSEENKPESNWFKFEKVGDKISGKVTDIFDNEAEGDFPAQRIYALEQADGTVVNVGAKLWKRGTFCTAPPNSYLGQRLKKVAVGDKVGFEFAKEIEPKVKGHNPAKSIEAYVKYTEEGDNARAFAANE